MADNSTNDYTAISIVTLQEYQSDISIDIYLKLPKGKVIKIVHKDDDAIDVVNKYAAKGIKELLLTANDYERYINRVREDLIEMMKEEDALPKTQVKRINTGREIFSDVLRSGRLDPGAKELIDGMAKCTVKLVNKTKIFDLLNGFKKNTSEQYAQSLMTAHIACSICNTFSWSTEKIKEKVATASILCDITLKPEDFEEFKEKRNDLKSLSTQIIEHPNLVVTLISNQIDIISPESLTIIKQHHERPNGKGFPEEIGYASITLLTSIYIVANYFVEQVFDILSTSELNDKTQVTIDKTVSIVKEKFYSGHFRKASEGLEQKFGTKAPEGPQKETA
jgi:HD-GYP domain-containing protein (c-di-GMP phosphodiesterase class II)